MNEINETKNFEKNLDSNFYTQKLTQSLKFQSEFRILESPNLKASIESNLCRIPDGSQAITFDSRELETKWDNRFNIVFSKDNHKVYRLLREYFDSPRGFEEGVKNNIVSKKTQRKNDTRSV
jgi:hypothetical protein